MIKMVVFDFDGVIVDSQDLMKQALRTCYLKAGKGDEPPYREFFLHMGKSLKDIFEILGLPEELTECYRQVSIDNINMVKLFPETKEMLSCLNLAGINCTLLTGKDRRRTIDLLQMLDIEQYFTFIVTPDELWFSKPNPEGILHILDVMDCKAGEAVMIGDAQNDIFCANSAGVCSVQMSWINVEEKIEEADYQVANWIDFCNLINTLNQEALIC